MLQQQTPPTTSRRWTPAEDRKLQHLHLFEQRTWPEIAQALTRTTHAVSGRWYHLKVAESSSFEDGDATIDEYIIDDRRCGLAFGEIGDKIGLPGEAVQGRWYKLQKQKVPEDVLALWRMKGEVKWSEKDDKAIIQACNDGRSEKDITSCVRFEGRYNCDVRERYKLLMKEQGTINRRLMGLDETKPAPHALDKVQGKKKYAWMEPRRVEFELSSLNAMSQSSQGYLVSLASGKQL